MDGVFMRKIIRNVFFCFVLAVSFWLGALIFDRQQLGRELVRLHVVANSDSREDQGVKLLVRDAVLDSLKAGMADIRDVEEAKRYLRENLPKLETLANSVLEAAGFEEKAVVTLCREAFDTRFYDTFSLPAGVYESLRIVIGAGEGHNWWCVAFPALCLPETTEGFAETAVEAGLTPALADTLAEKDNVEIRFFLLDCLGRLENILFSG